MNLNSANIKKLISSKLGTQAQFHLVGEEVNLSKKNRERIVNLWQSWIRAIENGKKLKKGDTADFKVIEFNKEFKRVVASHTATFRDEEEKNTKTAEDKASSAPAEKTTLGDIDALAELKAKMENKN